MKLLLLDGPRDPRAARSVHYRGTSRAHPTYCDALPEDHEINRLFHWFLEEGGELGVVRDRKKALRFAELRNSYLPASGHFEVVEVTDGAEPPEVGGLFMGYDLSEGYNNSLLVWELRSFLSGNSLAQPIRELCDLLSRYYSPQLNGQGLFQTVEMASLCLKSMTALQDLSPNLFEGGDLRRFKVVGLYRVS